MSRPRLIASRAALATVLITGLLAGCQAEEVVRPVSFTEVAADVGLDFQHAAFHWDVSADLHSMMGGGLCWIDYDGDGWLDLFLTNTWTGVEWGRWYASDGIPTSALYRNDRGEFEDVGEALPLPDSIQAIISARVDLLSPQDKNLLQTAAVVGIAVEPEVDAHITRFTLRPVGRVGITGVDLITTQKTAG